MKPTKNKAFQAEKELTERFEDKDSDDEDEVYLFSIRIKQLWKKRQNSPRRFRNHYNRPDSFSRGKSSKEVTCCECKESGHYRNACPKLNKENSKRDQYKKNSLISKKKGLIATWDDSDTSDSESEDKHANLALMATTSEESLSDIESDSEEVFCDFTRS